MHSKCLCTCKAYLWSRLRHHYVVGLEHHLALCSVFFFFNDTATTEIYTLSYTLSLHDALPIFRDEDVIIAHHDTVIEEHDHVLLFVHDKIGRAHVELQSHSEISYAVFCLKKKNTLILGAQVVIPIGGGDMPVVISLLNSYSGLAACAAGFVIQNNVLIVAGSLVGASGIILTKIMCKAINRSLSNVLFSGFGSVTQKASSSEQQGEVKPITAEDAFYVLEAARSVTFVPGYGM